MGHSKNRRSKILEAGLRLWSVDPSKITVRNLAQQVGVSPGTIIYHFTTVSELKNAIAEHAVSVGESRVIAQLIAMRHSAVLGMDEKTRRSHLIAAGILPN